MKINKKGQVKNERGDYRVGNFVFHNEPNHIKVSAISGIASWRVSLDTSVGMLMKMAIKEGHDNWLKTYASCIFSQLCIVPDPQFFAKHAELLNAQTAEHPEYYGKPLPTDNKDADDAILQEERELHEEVESLSKLQSE